MFPRTDTIQIIEVVAQTLSALSLIALCTQVHFARRQNEIEVLDKVMSLEDFMRMNSKLKDALIRLNIPFGQPIAGPALDTLIHDTNAKDALLSAINSAETVSIYVKRHLLSKNTAYDLFSEGFVHWYYMFKPFISTVQMAEEEHSSFGAFERLSKAWIRRESREHIMYRIRDCLLDRRTSK